LKNDGDELGMIRPPTKCIRPCLPLVGTAHARAVVGHEKPTDKQLPPKTWLVSGQ